MSKANMISSVISVNRKLLFRAGQIGLRSISCSSALKKDKNLYETLGLPRDASQADIKNAYFELSKLYHPDRIAATDENLAKFREVSAAYEILGNEQSRRLYDRGLLGRTKPGIDKDEPQDPIIKFYEKRQEFSRTFTKPYEEVDAWIETYFREAKKMKSKQQELYNKAGRIDREMENMLRRWPDYLIILFSCFLYISNFENTKAEKILLTFYGLFK